jgi:hypothetical protein
MAINGGLQHCIGKEVSRFEEGKNDFIESVDDMCIHYDGGRVAANESLTTEITKRGLRRTTAQTGLDRKTIRAVVGGKKVKISTLGKDSHGVEGRTAKECVNALQRPGTKEGMGTVAPTPKAGSPSGATPTRGRQYARPKSDVADPRWS